MRARSLLIFLFGLTCVGLTCAIDIATQDSIRFGAFYMVPITFVAWREGRVAGIVVALFASACYAYANSPFDKMLVANSALECGIYLSNAVVIGLLRVRFHESRWLANHDPVTGAFNQRAFERSANAILSNIGSPGIGMAFLDADHFKQVNDTHGHQKGTDVLIRIAECIQEHVAPGCTVARYGGDEFVIMQNGITKEEWVALVRRIVADVARTMKTDGLPVTLSAGATHIVRSASLEELMHECDLLMYRAKSQGRNRVESD